MHEALKKENSCDILHFNFEFETKALFCTEQVSMTHNNQCQIVKADWHCWES